MKQKEYIKRFLTLEEKLNIWNDKDENKFPYWAILRHKIFSDIQKKEENYPELIHAPTPKLKILFNNIFIKIKTILLLIKKKDYDIGFLIAGVNARIDERTGSFYDRIHQIYIDKFKKPLILQIPYQGKLFFYTKKECIFDYSTFRILSFIISKFIILSKRKKIAIKKFIYEKVRKITNGYISTNVIYQYMKKMYKRHIAWTLIYKRLLNQVFLKNKIFFIEDASYLSDKASLIYLLKCKRINVIEHQHGYIGPNHTAYNFSKDLIKNKEHPARKCLPDYLFLFGKFWKKKISVPYKFYYVGLHSLNQKSIEYIKRNEYEKSICIISDGTSREFMKKIAFVLAEEFPQYNIYLKLHPGEIPFLKWSDEFAKYRNLKVIGFEEPYIYIRKCKIIIGNFSTLLFEAIAFGNKRIFIKQNDNVPDELGVKFNNIDALISFIKNKDIGKPLLKRKAVWVSDTEKKFEKFLKSLNLEI